MLYYLENDSLKIRVSTLGAELQSLYSKKTEREYMWQKNETWNGHSILLFPTPGRVKRNRYIARGKEYMMPMHGFVKDMEFKAVEHSDARLVFELESNEVTKINFPYEFLFRVTFTLTDKEVVEAFDIINRGSDDMYFGFGAHPGFYCPIDLTESGDDYILEFDRPQNIIEYKKEPHSFLLERITAPFVDNTAVKPITEGFFDRGPVVADGLDADWICIRSKKSGRYMKMSIKGFPQLTLWGKGGVMSIICIEPWCGTSDFTDADCVWEHKYSNNRISPSETFSRELRFELG